MIHGEYSDLVWFEDHSCNGDPDFYPRFPREFHSGNGNVRV